MTRKRVKMFHQIVEFENFVNKEDIEIIKIDIKAVEQNYHYQEGFAAIVFYEELGEIPQFKGTKEELNNL